MMLLRLTRIRFWLAAVILLAGLAGFALAGARPGDTLYIKTRNTRVLKDASGAATVMAVLQPGTAVVWKGPDPKDKRWHHIEVGKLQGVVMTSNLSVSKPPVEVTAVTTAAAADTSTFMSSGAATKALGAGAIAYAKEQKAEVAAMQLQRAETLARLIGPEEVSEHARKSGLRSVIGASSTVAEVRQ